MIRTFRNRTRDISGMRRSGLTAFVLPGKRGSVLGPCPLLSDWLEALRGGCSDQYTIRIKLQWRMGLLWTDDGPRDVEIVP